MIIATVVTFAFVDTIRVMLMDAETNFFLCGYEIHKLGVLFVLCLVLFP